MIEVHFPGCRLSLDAKGKADIEFYSKDPKTKEGPTKQADVTFPEQDCDWIRARVGKPPQDSEICLRWAWQCI